MNVEVTSRSWYTRFGHRHVPKRRKCRRVDGDRTSQLFMATIGGLERDTAAAKYVEDYVGENDRTSSMNSPKKILCILLG